MPLGGRTGGGRNFERVLVIFRPPDEIGRDLDEIGRKMDETGRKVVDFFVHLRPPAVLSARNNRLKIYQEYSYADLGKSALLLDKFQIGVICIAETVQTVG